MTAVRPSGISLLNAAVWWVGPRGGVISCTVCIYHCLLFVPVSASHAHNDLLMLRKHGGDFFWCVWQTTYVVNVSIPLASVSLSPRCPPPLTKTVHLWLSLSVPRPHTGLYGLDEWRRMRMWLLSPPDTIKGWMWGVRCVAKPVQCIMGHRPTCQLLLLLQIPLIPDGQRPIEAYFGGGADRGDVDDLDWHSFRQSDKMRQINYWINTHMSSL